jgi:ketosteroid isomerase-like protein
MSNSRIVSNDPKTEKEIRAFFDEFIQAYPKENIQRYLDLFQQDENLIMIGTAQKWIGWENYKDALAKERNQFHNISLSYEWLKVNSYGDIGWLAAKVNVIMHYEVREIKIPARLTGVVKKINGKWKIVQGHISVSNKGR